MYIYVVCVCVCARVLTMCQNHARPWGFRDDPGRALPSWNLKWRHIRDDLAQSFCVCQTEFQGANWNSLKEWDN